MTAPGPEDLRRKEAELLAAGLSLQTEGLKLLMAEMQALAAMIPVAAIPVAAIPVAAIPVAAPAAGTADPAADDAATEAGFDNMPI